MTTDTTQITDNAALHRYELRLDGQLAGHLDYRAKDGNIVDLVHTEVGRAFEGKGLASQLARHALDAARSQGRKVIATCEYIQRYLEKHPEYRDLSAG
ncbi:MAG TPA: GNAT family N-acetyltransferase [Ramlibacter sp.]|jgi:predicted GNAT family acetyltransferase